MALDRRQLITGWEEAWQRGGDAVYGMFEAGAVVGGCGLHRRRGPHGLDIGYWVGRASTGRGVGTEAARLLTTAALAVPGVDHVEIHHDPANLASGAIPRRLGYRHVGDTPGIATAPGESGVDRAWRIAAAEWHPDRAARSH
jgi:RimJ/RimL family protein N-acetyltransferase